jgi:hypothetical protein
LFEPTLPPKLKNQVPASEEGWGTRLIVVQGERAGHPPSSEKAMEHSKKTEFEADLIRLHRVGADVDTLLGFMREKGLDQPDSLVTLMKITGLSLSDARDCIVGSQTWADHRESNLNLQADLVQALLDLSQERDPNFEIVIEPDDSDEPDS